MESLCDKCGAKLADGKACVDLFHELAFYTLSHPDQTYFIHQLIVDAYGAQHLDKNSKKISVGATLLGLYWKNELGFTGKEVQLEHMRLGKKMGELKIASFPKEKAKINVAEVLEAADKDEAIRMWNAAVWDMWKKEHQSIAVQYEVIKRSVSV
jgi:hypothetical protein